NQPTSITPLLALGEVYRSAQEMGKYRETMMAALKLDPEDHDLLHDLARRDEIDVEPAKAIATLETARSLREDLHTDAKLTALNLSGGIESIAFRPANFPYPFMPMAAPPMAEPIADALMANHEWPLTTHYLEPLIERHPDDYRLRYL